MIPDKPILSRVGAGARRVIYRQIAARRLFRIWHKDMRGAMVMKVHLDLDFTQAKKLVDRLLQKEKETLARYLDDQKLFDQMRRVQRELKDTSISMGEITTEVKAVRKTRAVRARSH